MIVKLLLKVQKCCDFIFKYSLSFFRCASCLFRSGKFVHRKQIELFAHNIEPVSVLHFENMCHRFKHSNQQKVFSSAVCLSHASVLHGLPHSLSLWTPQHKILTYRPAILKLIIWFLQMLVCLAVFAQLQVPAEVLLNSSL